MVAADLVPMGLVLLSHIVNGKEKPVLFASSTLSPVEKNYYLCFKKVLQLHLREKIYLLAASLQRWAVYVSMYDYGIKHRSGKK